MSTRSAPARILLVEDCEDDLELARRALRRCGRPVDLLVAEDGVAALELLAAAEGEVPDLILLDLKLPRLGGLDLLSRLRAAPATSLLPIVVLTSSVEEHDVGAAYRRGANSYLRKPVNFEDFAAAISDTLHYWLDLNQPPPSAGS